MFDNQLNEVGDDRGSNLLYLLSMVTLSIFSMVMDAKFMLWMKFSCVWIENARELLEMPSTWMSDQLCPILYT